MSEIATLVVSNTSGSSTHGKFEESAKLDNTYGG